MFTNSLTFNVSLCLQISPETFSGLCSPTTPSSLIYKKTIKQTSPFPGTIPNSTIVLASKNKQSPIPFCSGQGPHESSVRDPSKESWCRKALPRPPSSQMPQFPHHLSQILTDVWVQFMWQRCQSWQSSADPEGHHTDTEAIFIVSGLLL